MFLLSCAFRTIEIGKASRAWRKVKDFLEFHRSLFILYTRAIILFRKLYLFSQLPFHLERRRTLKIRYSSNGVQCCRMKIETLNSEVPNWSSSIRNVNLNSKAKKRKERKIFERTWRGRSSIFKLKNRTMANVGPNFSNSDDLFLLDHSNWLRTVNVKAPIILRIESSVCIDLWSKEFPFKDTEKPRHWREKERYRPNRYEDRNLIHERRVCFIIKDNTICRNTEDLPRPASLQIVLQNPFNFALLSVHLCLPQPFDLID